LKLGKDMVVNKGRYRDKVIGILGGMGPEATAGYCGARHLYQTTETVNGSYMVAKVARQLCSE